MRRTHHSAITISRADITWQQARAHVDGRVGLGQNQPIDLKLSADNLEVQSLLQAANQGGRAGLGHA